MNQQTDIS
uniref:Uncharacterized protein n=1 Tax=Timema monikensis TaxID=170555 RepID=A0A7R9EMR1_9NEOP|nr:unnamed protein product [Timema monikensis]